MADAVSDYGLLRDEASLDAGASEEISIIAAAGQDIRVSEVTASMAFVLMGLAVLVSNSSTFVPVSVGCDSASESWTTLYTVPEGYTFMGTLKCLNVGSSSGTYSFGVTVTEVEGESPGA